MFIISSFHFTIVLLRIHFAVAMKRSITVYDNNNTFSFFNTGNHATVHRRFVLGSAMRACDLHMMKQRTRAKAHYSIAPVRRPIENNA